MSTAGRGGAARVWTLPDVADRLIDGAMIAAARPNPIDAAPFFVAIAAHGASAADFVADGRRAEWLGVRRAVRARTARDFTAWIDRHDAPDAEVERALAIFEASAQRVLAATGADLSVLDSSQATLVQLVADSAEASAMFERDIIARDISWAVIKAAIAASADYAGVLSGFTLRAP